MGFDIRRFIETRTHVRSGFGSNKIKTEKQASPRREYVAIDFIN